VQLVDSKGTVIAVAPTATDLFGAGENTYLDLPGNPLNPGCSYEQRAKERSSARRRRSAAARR
jgi:hypothetical protein